MVDPLRLSVVRVLYRHRPAIDGSHNEPVWDYSLLDFDSLGDFALMSKNDNVYRWDGEGEPVLIGRGFKRAAW